MRLWTVHPRYLDPPGLVAAWREGLLAQAVLSGHTKGYRNHPQLHRFMSHPEPLSMIASYLRPIYAEACDRKYNFALARINNAPSCGCVNETEGQLQFEWQHLLYKLKARSPSIHQRFLQVTLPEAHPLFKIVPGEKRPWERG